MPLLTMVQAGSMAGRGSRGQRGPRRPWARPSAAVGPGHGVGV